MAVRLPQIRGTGLELEHGCVGRDERWQRGARASQGSADAEAPIGGMLLLRRHEVVVFTA